LEELAWVCSGWLQQTASVYCQRSTFALGRDLFIVAVSVACGLIPTLSPSLLQHLPAWISPITHTGVVLGSIVAFLLNLFFNGTTAQQIPSTPTTYLPTDEDQM
jgi:xanthine/uracil permease